MTKAISLRADYNANKVRKLSRQSNDGPKARRLLSIAAIYDGKSRHEAAIIGGMDRQSLRDWVHRFNEQGPDGLRNRRPERYKRRLMPDQIKDFMEIVGRGPDLKLNGIVRWRRIDLKKFLILRFHRFPKMF